MSSPTVAKSNSSGGRITTLGKMLKRREVLSEYCSPTYTPVQLVCLAQIVEQTSYEDLRELALSLGERIWMDLLMHFHQPPERLAGPFLRAYTVDVTSRMHYDAALLYVIPGDRITVNIMNTLLSKESGSPSTVVHAQSMGLMAKSLAEGMDSVFHCPEYLIEAVDNRQYPFVLSATTETTSCNTNMPYSEPTPIVGDDIIFENGSTNGSTYTFMTEDYALGSSDIQFHTGVQTYSPYLVCRRAAHVYERVHHNRHLPDEGRKHVLQDANSLLAVYWSEMPWRPLCHNQPRPAGSASAVRKRIRPRPAQHAYRVGVVCHGASVSLVELLQLMR